MNKNYLSFIGTMLIFGTIGIFRRYIPLSSAALSFTRGLLGAAFIFAARRGISVRLGKKKTILAVLTGALIGINWIFLFEAFNYTTVARATLCYYMQPTIVILLSPVILGEKLTGKKILCAAAAVLGMVLVSGITEEGGAGSADAKGIVFGLLAAVFYSAVIFLNKKNPVDDSYGKTFIQLGSAAAALIPYLIVTGNIIMPGRVIDTTAVIMILVVGIVHTGIAYTLYFRSMEHLSSQTVAVLSYIDPVSALILSAIFLGEPMSIRGIAGAVLILGAALIGEL